MKLFNYLILITSIFMIACSTPEEEKTIDYKSASYLEQNKEYLAAYLDTIFWFEQLPIRKRDSIMDVYGAESEEVAVQQKIVDHNHDINEKKVFAFLEKYGWPGESIIGEEGSLTLANVIQHCDNDLRIKYLPTMRDAVLKGNLNPRFLVRAEDRIATEAGEPQIYGGQMKYYRETKSFNVWPVIDPENIDKRRAEIGLVPIAEHLKQRFDFEWNLEEQKERTKQFLKEKAERERKEKEEAASN